MIVNFQSLLPKTNEFWNVITKTSPDIIIGCETWLKPEINNAEIFPPDLDYTVYRNDRRDGYGGVLIATKNDLTVHEINPGMLADVILVDIQTEAGPLTVGSIYRPPSCNTIDHMTSLTNHLDKLNKNNLIWIGGDLNLPDIEWKHERVTGHQYPTCINNTFLHKIQDLNLTQINETPTRANKILDIFLTNRPDLVIKSFTIPGLSDHDIIITDNRLKANKTIQIPHKVTIWKKANIDAIRRETEAFSHAILNQTDQSVEGTWAAISNHLDTQIKNHIPTKTCSKKFHQPWINTTLKRLSRKKQRAWKKAKKFNTDELWKRYHDIKKKTTQINRKAYQNYVKKLIDEDSNKYLWKFIRNRKCENVGVAPLNEENVTYSTNKDKANILNNKFCSTFTLEDTINLPIVQEHRPTMPDITITKHGVQKLLTELKPKKAAGPDGIPSRLLQIIASEIAPALTKLFQLSLDTGELPSIWKHARVQPVYKKGDRKAAQNYRPISITCICCKILEHIVRSAITNHLEGNDILTDAQHGFRKRRSCETQLMSIIHDFASELNRGGQTDAVLLDFAKAFDKVPHQRLLLKLHAIGIQNGTLRWITSFLSGRTQEVVVGGESSNIGKVTSGVPQGSVLGPTLFLIYINDLPNNIRSRVGLFADDTIIYQHIASNHDCISLNNDLIKLQEWEALWQMEFNATKCHVLTITNKKNPVRAKYHLHGQELQHVESAKYLGIELSNNLKWDKHIARNIAKANRTSAFVWRNLKACTTSIQVHCFRTFVRPILEYASVVWDPHQVNNIKALEQTQRRAARRILNDFSHQSSASDLVRRLGLEQLTTRRKRDKVTMLYKILHNNIDTQLPSKFAPINRSTRGHNMKYSTPTSRVNAHLHSFFPSAIRLWNSLPSEAAEATSLEHLKRTIVCCIRDVN